MWSEQFEIMLISFCYIGLLVWYTRHQSNDVCLLTLRKSKYQKKSIINNFVTLEFINYQSNKAIMGIMGSAVIII